MIPVKDIVSRKEKVLTTEIERIEKDIDKVLINLKEMPLHHIEIELKYKISQEARNKIEKLYCDGGWQVDIRTATKREIGPASYNPQKQEETESFVATVIMLKARQ